MIWLYRLIDLLMAAVLCLGLLVSSTLLPYESSDQPRAFTRSLEFDYVSWELDAILLKNAQGALDVPRYLTIDQQHQVVTQYLDLVQKINLAENNIEEIYADPKILDKASQIAPLSANLNDLKDLRSRLGPLAEEVMQTQISSVLADFGLTTGGQPLPPLLYHTTPLPMALIISPRSEIRQDNNISLDPDLSLEQMVNLEDRVEKALNVSALVTGIGGVGTYPTMVMSTTDMSWLASTISHEWTHNFLTLRPLGINYFSSPEMRTINETTANQVGNEVGRAVLARFYPEYLPPPSPVPTQTPTGPTATPAGPTPTPSGPPPFNFNHEMHTTRINVDQMLKDGKIDQAEAYMEARRQFFWDHGYLIRKLNQAYFAFNGAYNDQPGGGAAGEDPVGPAVIKLRSQSASLTDFLNKISWVTSFDQLTRLLK
ncbi:MAG TPA: hypothetical protein VF313_07465 [Anaerolineaceae bacterium]